MYSWPMKMGPIGCPETSVRTHHYTLRHIPEERSSLLIAGSVLFVTDNIDKHYELRYTDYLSCNAFWRKTKAHFGICRVRNGFLRN
jgi:hypothetical protein